MRAISLALASISGLLLAFIYKQYPDGPTLGFCLILCALSIALLFNNDRNTLRIQAGMHLLLLGGAAYTFAHEIWWLGAPASFILAALLLGFAVVTYGQIWGIMRRLAWRSRVRAGGLADRSLKPTG